ncbi:MAG: hypothetical protein WD737_02595 [Gemmatimonadota bacterium]
MSRNYQTVRLAKDQPILRRNRRRRKSRPVSLERLQRDFWKHFDLEKFASDWRSEIGRPPVA